MKNRVLKNHLLRPLMVVILIVIILVVVRELVVPGDFGVHDTGFTYGWYRQGNIEDWKQVTVKYQGKDYCSTCHKDKVDQIADTPHAIIQCENCHGPAVDHPSTVPKLVVDTSREQCLRCHATLPYAASGRTVIKGIDPDNHNPGIACANCHNPHQPTPLPGA